MTPLMFAVLATLLTGLGALFSGVYNTDKAAVYIVAPLAIITSFAWRGFLGYQDPTLFERILFYALAGAFSAAFFFLGRRFRR